MASTLIKKISLINNSGLLVAQYPKPVEIEEETASFLASSLLTAVMAFAKEVHNSELKSLSLHDRILNFGKFGEYIILLEMSTKISDEVSAKLLTKAIKFGQEHEFGSVNGFPISVGEAENFLMELVGNIVDETTEELEFEQPLLNADYHSFNFDLSSEIPNPQKKSDKRIAEIITEYYAKGGVRDFHQFFIPVETEVNYILIQKSENHIQVGYLSMNTELKTTLFKMAPFLDEQVLDLKSQGMDVFNILQSLKSIFDISKTEYPITDEDNLSIEFLDNVVKKKVDDIVYALLTGSKIILVGDKLHTRIATKTLSLFSTHRLIDAIEWLDESLESFDEIDVAIVGMPKEQFEYMSKNSKPGSDHVIVDFHKRKVIGGKNNKFLENFIQDIISRPIRTAYSMIDELLSELVSLALKITELVLMEKEDAINGFKQLQKTIKDQAKFELVYDLAKYRVDIIDLVLTEISSAVNKAKNYLEAF